MTKTIEIHTLRITDHQYISVPKGAEILHAEPTGVSMTGAEKIWIYVLQDKGEHLEMQKRDILLYHLDDDLEHMETLHYVGTVVASIGRVFIFEGVSE